MTVERISKLIETQPRAKSSAKIFPTAAVAKLQRHLLQWAADVRVEIQKYPATMQTTNQTQGDVKERMMSKM